MDRYQKEGEWLEMDPENHLLSWQLPVEAEKSIIPRRIIDEYVLLIYPFLVFSSFSKNKFYILN